LSALLGTPGETGSADPVLENGEKPSKEELRLHPSEIQPNPFQPRTFFDAAKLAELADSIRQHGVLQPLIVRRRENGYQLVSGERRWRASQQAELTEVPVLVRDFDDQEMLVVALVENVQREDINPLEAAIAYKRLSEEFGLTQEEVAKHVGKSRSAVTNTMRLLNLPSEIQDSVSEGRITEGHARALLSIADPVLRRRTWQSLLESGGTVREAENAARQSRLKPDTPERERQNPNLQEVERRLRHRLGAKVAISQSRAGRGALTIEFFDDEDLNRILDALGYGE
jgi:ParB family chromosome partitioning protein